MCCALRESLAEIKLIYTCAKKFYRVNALAQKLFIVLLINLMENVFYENYVK